MGAHTGLVVARFFADGQFGKNQAVSATSRYALVSTLVAQSEASVGQNDALIGLGRHPTPLPPSHGGGTLGMDLYSFLTGAPRFAHTGPVATPPTPPPMEGVRAG